MTTTRHSLVPLLPGLFIPFPQSLQLAPHQLHHLSSALYSPLSSRRSVKIRYCWHHLSTTWTIASTFYDLVWWMAWCPIFRYRPHYTCSQSSSFRNFPYICIAPTSCTITFITPPFHFVLYLSVYISILYGFCTRFLHYFGYYLPFILFCLFSLSFD